MSSRTRLFVLAVSTPIIAFAIIGGYLGQAMAQDGSYRSLRVFQDVIELVLNYYVEPVDVNVAMRGAMRGLAEGLDPESAFLTPDLVKNVEGNVNPGDAEVGIDVTRQFYLRVVSVRDGSPADKAGLRAGDFIRAIDGRAAREISALEGNRLLHGAAGSKVTLLVIRGNTADPHTVELVRERLAATDLTSRMADATTGYIRLVEFTANSASRVKQAIDALGRMGATRYIIDVRGTSRGDLDRGIDTARLFVNSGTLAVRLTRANQRETVAAQAGDGAVTAPVVLLVDVGTAGPAEVFAAALKGNNRAELIGQDTVGRAARQRLIKLAGDNGLWLTYVRYLTPSNDPIHERGLMPDVEVELPEVEFGAAAPSPDATLQRAIERLAQRRAA